MKAMVEKLPKPEATVGLGDFRMSSRIVGPDFRVIEDRNMTDTVEDWSDVRSPSRAARRRRQGHRQRIRYVVTPKPDIYQLGDKLVMHPETARKFFEQIRAKVSRTGDDLMRRAMFGSPPPPAQSSSVKGE